MLHQSSKINEALLRSVLDYKSWILEIENFHPDKYDNELKEIEQKINYAIKNYF